MAIVLGNEWPCNQALHRMVAPGTSSRLREEEEDFKRSLEVHHRGQTIMESIALDL
jgi:hypothetical protein